MPCLFLLVSALLAPLAAAVLLVALLLPKWPSALSPPIARLLDVVQTPYDALNLNIITLQQYFSGIPAPKARANQIPLPLNSFFRLIRHKGRLGKHDKNNFAPAVYIIINRRNENNPNLRTKYQMGELCCRLGAHSRCYHRLDPIPPTEGGGMKYQTQLGKAAFGLNQALVWIRTWISSI